MGIADTDRMQVAVDRSPQCGYTRWRYGRRHTGGCVGRESRETALEQAREHALNRIAAAKHNRHNLDCDVPLMDEQDHQRVQVESGRGGGIVQRAECNALGGRQRRFSMGLAIGPFREEEFSDIDTGGELSRMA